MRIFSIIKKGIGANVFAQLVTLLIQLISIPIFLAAWGVNLYGEWIVLYSIPSLLMLSDLGFTSAASNYMAMEYEKKNYSHVIKIFQSTFILLLVFSIGILILIPILLSYIYNYGLFKFFIINYWQFMIIVIIFSLYISIILQCNLLNSYLRAVGKYHTGVYLENLSRIIEFIFVVIMLINKLSPEYIAFGYLLGRLLGYLINLFIFFKNKITFKHEFKNIDIRIIKYLVKPAFSFIGFPIGNGLNNFGIIFIINNLLGPSSVVIFNTVRTVTRSALQGVNIVNNAVSPQMTIAFSSNNIKLLKKLYLYCCRFSLFGSTFASIFLLLFGIFIIQYWTKSNQEIDKHFFYLILFSLPFNALWLASSVILASTNSLFFIGQIYLILSLVLLPIAYILGLTLGIFGIGLSVFFLDFFMLIFVLYKSLFMLNIRFYYFILEIFYVKKRLP